MAILGYVLVVQVEASYPVVGIVELWDETLEVTLHLTILLPAAFHYITSYHRCSNTNCHSSLKELQKCIRRKRKRWILKC